MPYHAIPCPALPSSSELMHALKIINHVGCTSPEADAAAAAAQQPAAAPPPCNCSLASWPVAVFWGFGGHCLVQRSVEASASVHPPDAADDQEHAARESEGEGEMIVALAGRSIDAGAGGARIALSYYARAWCRQQRRLKVSARGPAGSIW
ncbi:hypothetical protein AXG93_209s1110 [Marchantia polymorpha subsp. ruderalis]|uniref:Uncharacterized protein n=1 Tax=Marchantia polymorpha subsp. ruderalis TaxID=1480154 RepID=A0A176VIV5_MARPO|nr:hypothetical protein AXG93_209s1110 [Marchantia polymorpha subsp. ruderalis]